jgi:hypothetical protein
MCKNLKEKWTKLVDDNASKKWIVELQDSLPLQQAVFTSRYVASIT